MAPLTVSPPTVAAPAPVSMLPPAVLMLPPAVAMLPPPVATLRVPWGSKGPMLLVRMPSRAATGPATFSGPPITVVEFGLPMVVVLLPVVLIVTAALVTREVSTVRLLMVWAVALAVTRTNTGTLPGAVLVEVLMSPVASR